MSKLTIAHTFSHDHIAKLDVAKHTAVDIDALYETVVHKYHKYNPTTKKQELVEEPVQYVRTVSGERFAARDAGGGNFITVGMY